MAPHPKFHFQLPAFLMAAPLANNTNTTTTNINLTRYDPACENSTFACIPSFDVSPVELAKIKRDLLIGTLVVVGMFVLIGVWACWSVQRNGGKGREELDDDSDWEGSDGEGEGEGDEEKLIKVARKGYGYGSQAQVQEQEQQQPEDGGEDVAGDGDIDAKVGRGKKGRGLLTRLFRKKHKPPPEQPNPQELQDKIEDITTNEEVGETEDAIRLERITTGGAPICDRGEAEGERYWEEGNRERENFEIARAKWEKERRDRIAYEAWFERAMKGPQAKEVDVVGEDGVEEVGEEEGEGKRGGWRERFRKRKGGGDRQRDRDGENGVVV